MPNTVLIFIVPLAAVIFPLVAAEVQNKASLVPTAASLTPVMAAVLMSCARVVTVVPVAVTVVPLMTNVVPIVIVGPAMVPVTAGIDNCHDVDPTKTQAFEPGPAALVATESVPVFFHKRKASGLDPSVLTATMA